MSTSVSLSTAILNDNVLYGPPKISLVTQQHRLVIDQLTGAGAVWVIDERGAERTRLQGQPQIERARAMMPTLEALRGPMVPCVPHNETRIPDFETFDMLRSLGYIADDAPAPPSP